MSANEPSRVPQLNVLEVIKKTSEFFASKGIEGPRLNAELIVSSALGLGRMELYLKFERPVSDAELSAIREFVRRRGRREPLQYVLGHTEFHGLRIKTDKRALIPRPETELLVETVVERCPVAPGRILDLGTGSGAIALALASIYPLASVTAVDASTEALSLAAENASATGLAERVTLVESDWFSRLPGGGTYDLIISNPPYLSEAEVVAAAPEVRDHEPRGALVSASDGFSDLERILGAAGPALAPGGLLALETGIGHHAQLIATAKRAGYSRTESIADLNGRDRFFLAWR